jgi:hypothetical protein
MEIRNYAEGELRWVQASGVSGWVTGVNALTGLIGYIQAGFTYSDVIQSVVISDRGIPKHHKTQSRIPPELNFTVLYGLTAQYPTSVVQGASVAKIHFEMKMNEREVGSSNYIRFTDCVKLSEQFTEAENGNTLQWVYRALSVSDLSNSSLMSLTQRTGSLWFNYAERSNLLAVV